MITNAKIKRLTNDLDGLAAAIYSYQDRYRALPGDDINAATRWRGATVSRNANNGTLSGGWAARSGTGEPRLMWQHLRLAGLVPGATTGTASTNQPTNAFGGLLGAESDNYGLAGIVVCANNINGAHASIIDIQLDDGLPNAGSLRANLSTRPSNTQAATTYNPAQTYSVCRTL